MAMQMSKIMIICCFSRRNKLTRSWSRSLISKQSEKYKEGGSLASKHRLRFSWSTIHHISSNSIALTTEIILPRSCWSRGDSIARIWDTMIPLIPKRSSRKESSLTDGGNGEFQTFHTWCRSTTSEADPKMISRSIRSSHGSSRTIRAQTKIWSSTTSPSTPSTREVTHLQSPSEICPRTCSCLAQQKDRQNSKTNTKISMAFWTLMTDSIVDRTTRIQASHFTIWLESVHSSMLWSSCKVEATTTQTESSTHCKTHSWMHWVTTRMCERSCRNSFTSLSCIWIWTRSILARGRTSNWLMIFHCLLGANKTHTSSSWDSEKPLSAIMWAKTYANGSITYLATSNSALTPREVSTHIQASPTRIESIWRKLVKLTLIWPSHTSYRCTTMDKLQQTWFNSGRKSTQPKSIKKRFSNIIWLPTNSPIWKYTDLWTKRRTSKIITKPAFSAKFSKEDCHRFKERLSSRPSSSTKD